MTWDEVSGVDGGGGGKIGLTDGSSTFSSSSYAASRFSSTSSFVKNDSCAICIEDFASGNVLRRLSCGHLYHRDCIDKWLDRKPICPLCKMPVQELEEANTLAAEHFTTAALQLLSEREHTGRYHYNITIADALTILEALQAGEFSSDEGEGEGEEGQGGDDDHRRRHRNRHRNRHRHRNHGQNHIHRNSTEEREHVVFDMEMQEWDPNYRHDIEGVVSAVMVQGEEEEEEEEEVDLGAAAPQAEDEEQVVQTGEEGVEGVEEAVALSATTVVRAAAEDAVVVMEGEEEEANTELEQDGDEYVIIGM